MRRRTVVGGVCGVVLGVLALALVAASTFEVGLETLLGAVFAAGGAAAFQLLAAASEGVLTAPATVLELRGTAGIRLGVEACAPGDLDRDGVPDLVVVGVQASGSAFAEARRGADGATLWRFAGRGASRGLVAAGDVNGDGVGDVVFADDFGVRAASGVDGVALWTLSASPAAPLRVAAAGDDLDGDGVPDVCVVEAPEAALVALSGVDGAPLGRRPLAPRATPTPIAALGDLDGDGRAEVAFAERGVDGDALVVVGGARFEFARRLTLAAAGGGATVVASPAAGDFDGDGRADLAISVHEVDAGGRTVRAETRITAAHGGPAIRTFAADAVAGAGGFLAALGDVDGDGRGDLAMSGAAPYAGARGGTTVVSGATGAVLLERPSFDLATPRLARGADLDGDGTSEVLELAPFDDAGGVDAGRVALTSTTPVPAARAFDDDAGGDAEAGILCATPPRVGAVFTVATTGAAPASPGVFFLAFGVGAFGADAAFDPDFVVALPFVTNAHGDAARDVPLPAGPARTLLPGTAQALLLLPDGRVAASPRALLMVGH
ncbi:MAG TPA: VCBS repeat-containing protein [Planctomycetota bacterium]|nr:VCBS repeat-containing protein [Planctomycetota bacterium]